MRTVQKIARLHFDQPADGALESKLVASLDVKLCRGSNCRNQQVHGMVIKLVYQCDETRRAVVVFLGELRDAG